MSHRKLMSDSKSLTCSFLPPTGEQTHHVIKVIKVIKYPSKDTLLSLNCSITVTLVIKIYLEINYLIKINNATIQRQQSSFL
jgi:hypothetical protein